MKKDNTLKIDIPVETLTRVTLFILGLLFLFAVRRILVIVFIAFIIMSALYPSMSWLEKKRVPKGASIVLIYLLGTVLLIGTFLLVAIPVISQMKDFIQALPEYIDTLVDRWGPLKDWYFDNNIDEQFVNLSSEFAKSAVGLSDGVFAIFKQAWGIVGTIFGVISILMLSLYMLVEHDHATSAVLTMVPVRDRVRALKLMNTIEEQLGKWLQGQIILSVIIGVIVWGVLTILNVKFALSLAIIAGLLESIPNLGPILSLIPAWILVIATGTPFQMVAVPIAYWIIQQVENTYIVPQVMKKAVGLNPIITMVAFLVGAEIGGVAGAILAVPTAAVVQIFVAEYVKK